jgi:N-acetylglucosaminyldiphosphoundecaprenol N-acetyl-beta-D-mannosaminyltransferase
MIDRGKVNVIGVDVNVVDYEAAVARVVAAAKARKPYGVSALAVHGVMTGALDAEHLYRLNRLDLVTPDGQPVRWAMRFLHGEALPDRVYGPNMTLFICEAAAREGLSIYLYGSRQEVLDAWTVNLHKMYPSLKIAGSEPSKFKKISEEENREMVERIKASGADIVFVGLGCPRQEVYAFENKDALSMPLIAVGAAFDFHAGLLPQAPKWMQDRGLEWLFRLWHEPKRLWRRYAYLNPLFVWMVLKQKISPRSARVTETMPQAVRFG